MAKKSKQPELSTEEAELIKRVDDMMDPKKTEVAQAAAEFNETLSDELAKPAPEPELDSTPPPKPKAVSAPELPSSKKKITETELEETISPDAPPEVQQIIPDDSSGLDNTETDKAVDDIVAHESDTMLAIEDAKVERENEVQPEPKSGHGFFWFIIFVLALAAAGVAYFFLTPR